jgi:hypothetical protein
MILRIAYGEAAVYYEDSAHKGHIPTPEHVEDTLIRMERTLHRVWAGKTPEAVELMDEVDLTGEGQGQ